MNRVSVRPFLCVSSVLLAIAAAAIAEESGVDGIQAFERLKALEGTWEGPAVGEGDAESEGEGTVTHEFRVSAAGTVVMEVMRPGSDHEMINMYHLDGDELVITHFCAGGNQPEMKLDPARSAEGEYHFEFVGGRNVDPGTDEHIHSAIVRLLDEDSIESVWSGWREGEPAGTMRFSLSRTSG